MKAGNVKEITSQADSIEGELTNATTYDPPGDDEPVDVTQFETQVPAFIDRAGLTELLSDQEVVINAEAPDEGRSLWATLLLGFLPTLLLIGFFVWLARRQLRGGAGGVLGGFGRATARRFQAGEQDRVTFDDVAGIDDAEDELVEIVDFLKRPERYRALGARIPRGVLLYGPPGTGKTLLARAVAGEADAAFFSLSASEFVEAIVGVGASRVRDLFKQAKEAAPAIVFIDELDAVGRSRSGNVGGLSGGNDEREQTLNQILTEMDGFEAGTNVIVLGATNRPEVLDQALLRPGRFDRRIAVQPPDKNGRAEILRIHTRSIALGSDVDLEQVAAATPGATGADLSLIANEAALFAARREPQGGRAARLHRRDREDDPRHRAPGGDERRGSPAHGVSRRGTRPRRHADAWCRPRSEDLDHPARPGARRDAVNAGKRPLQLRARRADREDQGRAGRARGGEGHLRRGDDRRRVRHPEPDAGRARNGGALGHERGDRAACGGATAAPTECCSRERRPRRPRPRSSSTTRRGESSSRRRTR